MLNSYKDALPKHEFMSMVSCYEILETTCMSLGIVISDSEVEQECIEAIADILSKRKVDDCSVFKKIKRDKSYGSSR